MSSSLRKILVLGGGGREHALARRLASSPSVGEVLVAPGNPGTAAVGRNVGVSLDDVRAVGNLAEQEHVDLVVVGPEAPLVRGVADELGRRGIATFGPSAAAARLEGSKAFMKNLAARCGVATAPFRVFDSVEPALAYIRAHDRPLVVKADGLCAGKGVVVAADVSEAVDAALGMLSGEVFGDAGRTIVVEDRIGGAEASVHAICDGERFLLLPAVQDHKRISDGDYGPNTGGMGAYGPAPVVTKALEERIAREMIEPTLRGMADAGCPFRGVLFAGIMITSTGDPILLEYNVRFGDPETEVLMELMDGNLAEALAGAAAGRLDPACLARGERHALAVVLAAHGYPGTPRTGNPIEGLSAAARVPSVRVLHAGTRTEGGRTFTAGGRVLVVVAESSSLRGARDRAYEAAGAIRFDGMQVRTDIGHRALR